MRFKLRKWSGNPVLSPLPDSEWQSLSVCNPGAWYEDGTFYLLYRAAGNDPEHIIRLGLATSQDGFHFERASDQPVFDISPDGPDGGCVEDARIVKFDGIYYVTYAYRPYPPGRYWEADRGYTRPKLPATAPAVERTNATSSGLAATKDFRTWRRLGRITRAGLDNRDVILFPEKIGGRYVMLHRPDQWVGPDYGCEQLSIWLAFGDDLLSWGDDVLLATGEQQWESGKLGGSTPPLRTDAGWLTIYHAVGSDWRYRVGVMMLDLEDPRRVVARAPDFIMEPEAKHETEGIYAGCVFPTGNVVVDGTLFVYYGAGDRFVGCATAPIQELVDYVMQYRK
jgi:predicted GH43/DUF377 family glycosyl hydrolase